MKIASMFTGSHGRFSKTTFWFWIVSTVSVVIPLLLLCLGMLTGGEWIDYMKFSVPTFFAAYIGSKKLDSNSK